MKFFVYSLTGALVGGIVGGLIGFAIGFLGATIYAPRSNLGLIAGIVWTGPVGVIVGTVGGIIGGHRWATVPEQARMNAGWTPGWPWKSSRMIDGGPQAGRRRISIRAGLLGGLLVVGDLAALGFAVESRPIEPPLWLGLVPLLNAGALVGSRLAWGRWATPEEAARRRRLGVALGVVAACLYVPFVWLPLVDFSGRADWLSLLLWRLMLWPVMPGAIPGMIINALFFRPGQPIGLLIIGTTATLLLVGLTRLGASERGRLILAAGLALLVSVPTMVGAFLLIQAFDTRPVTKTIAPADAGVAVTEVMVRWEALGPTRSHRRQAIGRQVQGIRGFTESGGWHGDGTDWYEVDLAPDLAAELKASLPQVPGLDSNPVTPYSPNKPPWWPAQWPADVRCYRKNLTYLWLSTSGTRAWLLNIRT